MAWGIGQGMTRTALPKFHVEPPRNEIRPSDDYLRANGLWPIEVLSEHDIEIEDRFWPKSGRLQKPRKVLPHYIGLYGFSVFSEDMCDCIEEFEPGVHQFHQVEIRNVDGTPFARRYYAVQNRNVVNESVDLERTTLEPKVLDNNYLYFVAGQNRNPDRKIFLAKNRVSHLHFYMTSDVMVFRHFVSNELFATMKRRRVLPHLYTAYFEEV